MEEIIGESPKATKKNKLALGLIVGLAVIIVGTGGYFGYRKLHQEGQKTDNTGVAVSSNTETSSAPSTNVVNDTAKIESELDSVDTDIASADSESGNATDGLNDQAIDLN